MPSAWLGNKIGAWTYTIDANFLRTHGQPMQYVTLQTPSTSSAAAVPVTSAVEGVDQTGKPWYFAGPNGSAIEDDTQQQFKLKVGYDFAPNLYGEMLYTHWHNDGRRSGATLLRDAAGDPVYSGLVSVDGVKYVIPAGSFSPQNVEETHDMLGLKLADPQQVRLERLDRHHVLRYRHRPDAFLNDKSAPSPRGRRWDLG